MSAAEIFRPADAGQLAELFDIGGDVIGDARLGAEHRNAERLDARELRRRIAAVPADHQIGLQRQQRFEVEAGIRTDARQRAHRRRKIRVLHDPDQRRPGTGSLSASAPANMVIWTVPKKS